MTAYDFRDQDPAWFKYAEWIGQGHDKYYEVRIDLADDGQFVLTKRWGPRPDNGKGQIKVETCQSMTSAISRATGWLDVKLRKGYKIAERPLAANGQVAEDWSDEDAD